MMNERKDVSKKEELSEQDLEQTAGAAGFQLTRASRRTLQIKSTISIPRLRRRDFIGWFQSRSVAW